MFTVTDTVSFDIDDEAIITTVKEDFLPECDDPENIDEENLKDFIRDCLCDNEYDLCQYADSFGGEDWFEEEVVDPIAEKVLASIKD